MKNLKFGLSNSRIPLAAAAPTPSGTFRLVLGLNAPGMFGQVSSITLDVSPGATINWGDGTTTISNGNGIFMRSVGSTITITGPNTISYISAYGTAQIVTGEFEAGKSYITSITGTLPTSLVSFSYSLYAEQTTGFPTIPAKCESVVSSGLYPSTVQIPSQVKRYSVPRRCTNLTIAAGSVLIRLDASNCSLLTSLPALPTTCTSLDIINSTGLPAALSIIGAGLTTIGGLPSTTTSLNLSGCTSLTTLPTLPTGLTSLTLSGTKVKALNLSGNTTLTSLPALPTTCTSLNLTGCTGLPAALSIIGAGLTTIGGLPSTTTSLNLSGCTSLTTLPTLPTGLTSLNLSGTKVTALNLSGNTTLTSLPALPTTCTSLNLTGCTGITSLRINPSVLKTATFTGSGITRPSLLLIPSDNVYTF